MAILRNIQAFFRLPATTYSTLHNSDVEEELELLDESGHIEHQPPREPAHYAISPFQQWVTPLMRNARRSQSVEIHDLPQFSTDAAYLRLYLAPLKVRQIKAFLFQREIGGKLVLGGMLEVYSLMI